MSTIDALNQAEQSTKNKEHEYVWPLEIDLRVVLRDTEQPHIILPCPEDALRGIRWLTERKKPEVELVRLSGENLSEHRLYVRIVEAIPQEKLCGADSQMPMSVRHAHELHHVPWDKDILFSFSVKKSLSFLDARRLAARAKLLRGVRLMFVEKHRPETVRFVLANHPVMEREHTP